MGIISARFRKKKDEDPAPQPQPIKRYRVQSMPVQSMPAPQRATSASALSHRAEYGNVTEVWKRGSIRILEPSDVSNSSMSMYSEPSLETQLSFKFGPQQTPAQVATASPTFSMCGSTHSLSPSPSLEYSASFSSGASVASRGSQRSTEKIDAGIPPLLPAHRTFSGSPHYGSFHRPSRHRHTKSAASDFIPLHVFTREARHASPQRDTPTAEKRFNLDGYTGGLKVVNITPPSSPPPVLEPGRYRVPSKAYLMD